MSDDSITINAFHVGFAAGGHPVWTEIGYRGQVKFRVHHAELKDLEYAIGRIRDLIRAQLPEKYRHEV